MANKTPSTGRVLFNFIFGLLTGGLWWLWLLVRFLSKK